MGLPLTLALRLISLGAEAAEGVRYVHTDHLGTPVVWTDENGNIIKTSEYEPYGQLLNRATKDGQGYTGHVEDAATGLTYMQQRYYDPGIGMFLSVDPVTAHSNPVGQFNRYRCANGNPYMYTDPDCRVGVAGAILGGALDIAVQSIAIAASDDMTISDFSVGSVNVSAGAGAIDVGVATKIAQLGTVAKVAAGIASDAAISTGSTALKGEEVTAAGVAIDVLAGQSAGKMAGDAYADVVTGTSAYKVAERQADRLARIANKPDARRAQVDRAENAAADLVKQEAAAAAEGSIVGSNAASEAICSTMSDC